MNISVWCRECGEFSWDWWLDAPDPSVGYPGGLTLESSEETCPTCGAPPPTQAQAECGLATDAADAAADEADRRYCEERDDRGCDREVEWEVMR